MSDKNTGGAAFPNGDTRDNYPSEGMTLRDYFAAKAMQGIMTDEDKFGLLADAVARDSYAMADAMLRARENT